MFSRKTRRERARSTPAISDSEFTGAEKRFGLLRKRPKGQNHGGRFYSARQFDDHGSSSLSSFSVDDTADALSPPSSNDSPARRGALITPSSTRNGPLIKALVAALQKDHMLDVTLVGREGVAVRASRYVLACRCEALEDKLYTAETCTQMERQEEEAYIGEYSEIVIKALVEYCFTGELLEFWKLQSSLPDESAVERIVELSQLSHAYHFRPLKMENYQLSRRLMNQHPSTACLFYSNSQSPLDIKSYARQTIQECTREALLCSTNNHVTSLPPTQLEELFINDDATLEDLDEMDKVKLLQLWSKGKGNDLQVARRCSSAQIDLSSVHLDEQTVAALKSSNLFDEEEIAQALSTPCPHEDDDQSQYQVEHVIVQGAGMEAVNGRYLRDLEQDDDEDMYVTSCGAMTLYCWNGTWHIAAACDLSNSLYQCSAATRPLRVEESGSAATANQCLPKVPSNGWQSVGASDPVPHCTWIPATKDSTVIEEDEVTSSEELSPSAQ